MKRIITFPTLIAAAAVLAGCDAQSGENGAADQNNLLQAGETILLDDPQNVNSPAPSIPSAGIASEPSEPSKAAPPDVEGRPRSDEPPGGNRATLADEQRRPPPKAPRPRPEPDPHAGHDMGDMANMSHD